MDSNNINTYISLFSSAGVGCYGFKKSGFECIATNEIIQRRLNIQKINNKCKYDSGYILGDITLQETKQKIFNEIIKWQRDGIKDVDVVIATPPCQGMSVANHKKTDHEIKRNSLVVESIDMISSIKPNFFIFENVAAFMKTGCIPSDNIIRPIGEVIYDKLGDDYVITHRIINFKNYGSNSSRTRTIVIGVNKKYADYIAPIELFPQYRKEKTLREVIGHLPSLEWGEFCSSDFFHQFRTYDESMRCWIHDLLEGESAFDNEDPLKRPHQIIDGKIVQNVKKNGDKYRRQNWDSVAPCIHTRNDQLASQNTIHPHDDRVFSIRELMLIMTIPFDFKWFDKDLSELNNLELSQKKLLLKKEEINIRQSIGEAVPTSIFFNIAENIKSFLSKKHLSNSAITNLIEQHNLKNTDNLKDFLKLNSVNCDFASLSRIAELANTKRESNSAYFTNKFLVNQIISKLPDATNDEVTILEPSVGIGNFLPPLMRKYENLSKVNIDICDIDESSLELVEILLSYIHIPENVTINYICDDFLTHSFNNKYFLVIGNPPFTKLLASTAKKYLVNNINQNTTNLFEFFLEKALSLGDHVVMITPKSLLNTPEFIDTRNFLKKMRISCIEDFGEQGFKGVLVETICIFIDPYLKPNKTKIISTTLNKQIVQEQDYICDDKYPYWIIYRNTFFDKIASNLTFDIFNVFRDRQLTNSNTYINRNQHSIRVVKSRNIDDTGENLLSIDGYDSYIDDKDLNKYAISKFYNRDDVYLTPNMTYKPRVMKKQKGYIINGSVAVLIPKYENIILQDSDLIYFSTDEYREFYKIARNFQTRSLNIDNTSVFWFGVRRD